MKEKSKFKQGLERILASVIIFAGGMVGSVKADGTLNIRNYVDSTSENYLQVGHFPESCGVTDGWDDEWDGEIISFLPGGSYVSSDINDINHPHLNKDWRPNTSIKSFNLEFIYNGVLGNSGNYLEFSILDNGEFGNKPIIFQQTSSTNPNAFYPVYDVRRAIADNNGVVPLEDVAADTYDQWNPYGSGDLQIGTRLLADIKNEEDGKVNLSDYAVFADEWKNFYGQFDINSVADISGSNGIPDKKVDGFDMKAFREGYLRNIDDPNTW